jgi:hypothetical protein
LHSPGSEPPIDTYHETDEALAERDLQVGARSIAGPWRWTGFVAALLIAASAPIWHLAGNEWRLTLPGVPFNGEKPVTTLLFLSSAGVLAVSWMLMVRRIERSTAPDRARTRAIIVTAALWFVPVLLGPPLLSSDVYSYAAQGEMVTKGLDPTSQGMSRLQFGEYVLRVDPIWRTPQVGNGYGPVGMGASAVAVLVTGHHALNTVMVLRLISVLGIALAGWGVLQVARHQGLDPPTALAFAVLNPIVVLHVVGGGHNDGLLIGLLMAGIALTMRKHWWWGVVLIAMAASVKLPAALVLPYLAWTRPGHDADWRARVRSMVETAGVSIAVIGVFSVVVGVGLGWINAMRNAGVSKGTLAITTQLGFIVADNLSALGLSANENYWIDALRLVGMGTIGLTAAWLLYRSTSIGALPAAAIGSLVLVLLGPVVWPWYFAAAIALFAVCDMGRWRGSLMLVIWLFACEVFPSGPGGSVPDHNHVAATLVLLAIGVIALTMPFVPGWWAAARERSDNRVAMAD